MRFQDDANLPVLSTLTFVVRSRSLNHARAQQVVPSSPDTHSRSSLPRYPPGSLFAAGRVQGAEQVDMAILPQVREGLRCLRSL